LGESVRILVIGVGGTIASVTTSRGIAPGMGAGEILRRALGGKLPRDLEVEFLDLMRVDSSLMLPQDWVKIASTIFENYWSYDAFLVLHGTDTMAYTAASLAFSLRGLGKPVVLTGSMRILEDVDTDVPANLWDSLVFSREAPKLGLSGVYIVFHGKVILGVRASKVSSVDVDAFTSINYPYIAYVEGEEVSVNHVPARQVEGPLRLEASFDNSIAVLKAFPGIRAGIIDSVLSTGVRGIIVESFGLGGLPEELITKLSKLSSRVPIVVTSQPTYGGVDLRKYEVGVKLLESGVIPACDMSKEATTVKLMWLLGKLRELCGEELVSRVRREMLRNYEDEVKPCYDLV